MPLFRANTNERVSRSSLALSYVCYTKVSDKHLEHTIEIQLQVRHSAPPTEG